MGEVVRGQVLRLETAVPCGFPECMVQTQHVLFEAAWGGGSSDYTTIELIPFCPEHEAALRERSLLRYEANYDEEDDENLDVTAMIGSIGGAPDEDEPEEGLKDG